MKIDRALLVACVLVLFSASAISSPPSSPLKQKPTEQQLADKMRQCMSHVEPNTLKAFEVKGLLLTGDIQSLCREGKRSKAQNLAYGFATEMHKSTALATYRLCRKIRPESDSVMQQLMKKYHVSVLRYKHACEQATS